MSEGRIDTFGSDIFRNSIYIDKLNLAFSQFVVRSPSGALLAISAGMRADFDSLKRNMQTVGVEIEAIATMIVPHFEADEMAALPDFLAANPALIAYAHPICAHALSDIFSVKTKILKDEVPVTIHGEVVIPIHVKHVHQWDSLVVYLPRLKALFASDIFMSYGPVDVPAASDGAQPTQGRIDDAHAHAQATGSADGPLASMIQSIETSGYLPSLDYLGRALDKIKRYDIEWIFPMHGAALHDGIAETVAGLSDYCQRRVAANA